MMKQRIRSPILRTERLILVNASGQEQEYTYDKAKKQTGVKEYDGKSLIKSIKYDYDETCVYIDDEYLCGFYGL